MTSEPPPPKPPDADIEAHARAQQYALEALDLVSLALPHLSGLARKVQVYADTRVATAGIFQSGRLLVNPAWFVKQKREDAVFVMAHELLHLALRTHNRTQGTDHEHFNIAHDYIINDMLAQSLGRPVPEGGLVLAEARTLSAEHIVRMIQTGKDPGNYSNSPTANPMADALRKAGLARPGEVRDSDVLTDEQERKWFSGVTKHDQRVRREQITQAAARAASLDKLRAAVERVSQKQHGGSDLQIGDEMSLETALRGMYAPPWQSALQRWMEATAPGPRSFARPSRRGADRTDLVLAGRKREGWTLNIVLDTSGSMSGEFPVILGAIASFCESMNVSDVRIVQCDVDVSSDEVVDIDQLNRFYIAGYGGSDMSPAMHRLAEDPEVEAVLVLTDGYIDYPPDPMPYAVLWVIAGGESFSAPYGQVIYLTPPSVPDDEDE